MKPVRLFLSFVCLAALFLEAGPTGPATRRYSTGSRRVRMTKQPQTKVRTRAKSEPARRQSQRRVSQVSASSAPVVKTPAVNAKAKQAGRHPRKFKVVAKAALATEVLKKQALQIAQEGNDVIRNDYVFAAETLPELNRLLIAQNVPLEKRARIMYQCRHRSRLRARRNMKNQKEVDELKERDKREYGREDGPTFDDLMKKNMKKGQTREQAMESIIRSAQRTNSSYNELYGAGSQRVEEASES